jgi:hypothetical protein
MAPTEIARVLGGEKVLGREIRTNVQLEECTREGFPVGVLQELIEHAVILPGELYGWLIPRRTLAHRQKNQQRLSLEGAGVGGDKRSFTALKIFRWPCLK